jgi:hypothetical protein
MTASQVSRDQMQRAAVRVPLVWPCECRRERRHVVAAKRRVAMDCCAKTVLSQSIPCAVALIPGPIKGWDCLRLPGKTRGELQTCGCLDRIGWLMIRGGPIRLLVVSDHVLTGFRKSLFFQNLIFLARIPVQFRSPLRCLNKEEDNFSGNSLAHRPEPCGHS